MSQFNLINDLKKRNKKEGKFTLNGQSTGKIEIEKLGEVLKQSSIFYNVSEKTVPKLNNAVDEGKFKV